MAGAVANCKRCGKVFQKVRADICAPCVQVEEEQFTVLYRALQKSAAHGGVAITDLAAETGIPVDEIERYYMEGRLSTAGTHLKMPCQACGMMMRDIQRKGRYCVKCSEATANKARVEVKSVQELEKADAQDRLRQQQLALLKKNQSVGTSARRFGSSLRQR
jgi:protein-arginine kinase activator protein McsA